MAEQVDAADLKSVGRKAVPVRFRPSAPFKKVLFMRAFLIGMIYQSIEAARCRFEPQFAGERSAPVKFLSEQGRRSHSGLAHQFGEGWQNFLLTLDF